MSKAKFVPLLFGGDINVYSVARAIHQEYGLKSTVYGKYPSGPCFDSSIIDLHTFGDDNDKQEVFLKNVCDFAAVHKDETVLLIGCGDSYVKLAAENLDNFPDNVIAPYVPGEMMNELIHKQRFYEMCDKYGIDHPATFVYSKEMGDSFDLPFGVPYILKPANSVMYWEYPYEGQKKVYVLKTLEELKVTLKQVYGAGYHDTMIIQDFIPGDDTYMRVLTNYSDRNGEVKLMCLGHVLLEEHTPHGIGNHAVIVNEVNQELSEKIRAFLNDIHFKGFSNFDIKYDQRDGKFKVFEINVRQGRSNFYVTGAGYNIMKTLVEDVLDHKELPFTLCDNPMLWMVVPKKVAFTYIKPAEYQKKMRELISQEKIVNPLLYAQDKGFQRRLRVWKNIMGQHLKFKKYLGS